MMKGWCDPVRLTTGPIMMNDESKAQKEPKFKREHPAAESINAVRSHRTFKYGDAWLSRFSPSATLDDVTDAIANDPIVPVLWAVWLLNNFGDEFDVHCRRKFIEKIAKNKSTEMHAFLIWRDALWLTDEEDALLEAIWKGRLPTVEDEIRKGLHPRKKSTTTELGVE